MTGEWRPANPVQRPHGGEHLCWVYEDPADFLRRAAAFLTAGRAAGQQLLFLGSGGVEALRGQLEEAGRFDELLADLEVRSLGVAYGRDDVVEPERQVADYAAATEAVLAAGRTGLCVVAEATALVRTAAQLEAFTRYEHLIDRYMAHHRFAAMCAYDVTELGWDTAAQLACLHPCVSRGAAGFQWSAAADDADVRLVGEIDLGSRELFDLTLDRVLPLQEGPQLVVDARALDFIDHRGLLALEHHAEVAHTEVLLRTPSPIVSRLVDLLGLRSVRVGWSS